MLPKLTDSSRWLTGQRLTQGHRAGSDQWGFVHALGDNSEPRY